MQKTRLGISVGIFGAAVYFTCLFSGYLVPVILTGYVLLFEENEWLRKNAVKAVALLISFSFLITVINLIPDAVSLVGSILNIFGKIMHASVLTSIINAVINILGITKTVLFVILGIKAINQGSISVPVVDNLIGKYM